MTTTATLITAAQLAEADEKWANARVALRATIAAKQTAMHEYRATKTEAAKTAYDAQIEAHKKAIDHIVEVRTAFHVLKRDYQRQTH